jgi:hypothetical protein
MLPAMMRHGFVLLALAAAAAAEDAPAPLKDAAAKIGVEFKATSPVVLALVRRDGVKTCDTIGVFRASLTSGLTTCDWIDIEVRMGDGGAAEVLAYPRVGGERLEPRRNADKAAILAKLGEPCEAIAPLAWVADGEVSLHAAFAAKPDEIERAILAVPAIDAQVAGLLQLLKPALSEEQVRERLKAAGAEADEARRNAILREIAAYLPDLVPTEGRETTFLPLTMNRHGVAFDAFRFRVPGAEGERRLAWAFAHPPGTVKGWFIAPMGDDAQKFVKFHRGGSYEGVPSGYASVLQRSDTPLKAGAEYVLWFMFKVETPVEMRVALSCVGFDKADRDALSAIEKALGLKPPP